MATQPRHPIIGDFTLTPSLVLVGQEVTLHAHVAFARLGERHFQFSGPDSTDTPLADHKEDREAGIAYAKWTATAREGDTDAYQRPTFYAQVIGPPSEEKDAEVTVITRVGLRIDSITSVPSDAALTEGDMADVTVSYGDVTVDDVEKLQLEIAWALDGRSIRLRKNSAISYVLDTTGFGPGAHTLTARLVDKQNRPVTIGGSSVTDSEDLRVVGRPLSRTDTLKVSLQRSSALATRDQVLWALIRDRTLALSFSDRSFTTFVDDVLVGEGGVAKYGESVRDLAGRAGKLGAKSFGMAAYDLLKTAAEVFLLINCGVLPEKAFQDGFDPDAEAARGFDVGDLRERLNAYFPSGRLPYLDRIVRNVFRDRDPNSTKFFAPNALTSRANAPCLLELIWSYWLEEGMLNQTMNAISRRFQNIRAPGERDPLAHLEIDPLRPLNNLIWGYIQDETNLLTVRRRAYEYDHHYGLTLYGKAVPTLRPADSRSKFLEAFHNLLHMTAVFYKEDNDTTVIADGYPLLNALREVHLVLAQGAHNQFGDLPWTARAEMLMQQWILARPEMREFLQSRPMVPYKEGWMAQVDTMKTLQGWSDVTVTHFRDLGVYGEQILLTIRYGDWIDVNDENAAKNWARYWRPEVQGYLHAYRAVTGVDLTNPEGVDYTMPAVHLQKRLTLQRAR